ncbi:hypothetical protein BCR33DRAFT_780680 [Rhizoclosmatium globosum]|uniref:Uncharacterized protein n=1 Tax=Rhizoclosmatium globosum TaxID=329046 RepID=A0A1Y2CUW7_9FUNG|nr:hypothetical protein BCR33DRAFT_780680 [Rhizoclosmatium globosum]|eukprot:ORY50757.1 hypothetical protein BCR33DRAFT_780680 [Rhizoclosmatium globosum]
MEQKEASEIRETNAKTEAQQSQPQPESEDTIDSQRSALDSLITTIKPLLPKISNHLRAGAKQPQPTDLLASQLESQVTSEQEQTKSVTGLATGESSTINRRSFKNLFVRSPVTSTIAPEPTPLKPVSSSPTIQVQTPAVETLASAPMSDDTLALALASLCNALYRVIETMTRTEADIQELSNHAKEIAQLQSLSLTEQVNLSPEQKTLWIEIDKMMALVQTLCLNRCHILEKPPSYESAEAVALRRDSSILSIEELHSVAAAIERVVRMAPKLFDQTVTLSARQERLMDEAALTGLIDRLFHGREDFQAQRASPDSYIKMSRLVDQIVKSSKRSMDNQRMEMSESFQQKMDGAKLMNAVERQSKTRFKGQDWVSKETQLINELATLQANLMKACGGMPNQRVELTDAKEREMFLGRLVGRMQSPTFDSQTAYSVTKKKKDDEIDSIMDKISKSSAQLSNQRA